jgi:hypothetical protein
MGDGIRQHEQRLGTAHCHPLEGGLEVGRRADTDRFDGNAENPGRSLCFAET